MDYTTDKKMISENIIEEDVKIPGEPQIGYHRAFGGETIGNYGAAISLWGSSGVYNRVLKKWSTKKRRIQSSLLVFWGLLVS
jgi:hypothetical protein